MFLKAENFAYTGFKIRIGYCLGCALIVAIIILSLCS